MRRFFLIVVIVLYICQQADSEVLTGPITGFPESTVSLTWGDGVHDLKSCWSVQYLNSSGYVYGSSWSDSTADVYVYHGLSDIKTINDASAFSYVANQSLVMDEGDYVFFRGTNGYYGAWRVDNIFPSGIPIGQPGTHAYLDGQWYFQDDGSASFVPEPATIALLSLGALFLRKRS